MNKEKKISVFKTVMSALIGGAIALTLQLELYVEVLIIFVTVVSFNKALDMFLLKKD